ncbi:hypothetical protein [Turicibacter bilis]|uniref:hypothetical protein n=1 Tax=Turicibacter bilis TaxID=2735723 RepID=UPI0031BAF241
MKKWEKPMIQELNLSYTMEDGSDAQHMNGWQPQGGGNLKIYHCCNCKTVVNSFMANILNYTCNTIKFEPGQGLITCGGKLVEMKKVNDQWIWQCS